ncbi:hypothetical protein KI387_023677, partial [Taxus chinensis]
HDTNIGNMVKYKMFMEKISKRKLKSPEQVEGLEQFYAEHKYPSEVMKANLAVELMLSKEQVHKWFCHRRQKEKKLKKADIGMGHKPHTNRNLKKDGGKKVKHLRFSSLREGENQRILNIRDNPNAIENTYVRISSSQERSILQNGSPCEIESTRMQFQSGNCFPVIPDRPQGKRQNPYRIESKRRKRRALELDMEQNNLQEDGNNQDVTAAKTHLCTQFYDDGPPISVKFDPLPQGAFDVPIEPCHEDIQLSRDLPQMAKKKNVEETRKMRRSSLSCSKNLLSPRSRWKGKDFLAPRSGGMGKALLLPKSGGMGKGFLPPRSGGMGKALLPPRSAGMGKALLPLQKALLSLQHSSPTAEAGNLSVEVDASGLNNIDDLYTNVGACQGNTGASRAIPDEGQGHLFSFQGNDKILPEDKNKRKINCQKKNLQKNWKCALKEKQSSIQKGMRRKNNCQKKTLQKNQKCALKEKQSSIQKGRRVQAIRKQKDGVKCNSAARKWKEKEKYKKPVNLVDNEHLELGDLQINSYELSVGAEMGEIGTTYAEYDEGLLARFPPATLRMKRPLMAHPWMDSKENVKKLFMVFRFLYTFARVINMCSFTLDEFVQAFHDHDSMLLGKIHIALLKLLLEDIEDALKSSRARKSTKNDSSVKDCGFLRLFQSVKCRGFDFKVRHKLLNPLTWPEILRQVILEAGFSPKQNKELKTQNRIVNKDENSIGPHGLVPGTLKHALFHVLMREGTTGLKVSEMAKHVQNSDLNDIPSSNGLEAAICSSLSSDITLFERISSSAFRLRANLILSRDMEQYHSCSESSDVESDYEESDSEKSDRNETGESGYEEQNIPNTKKCAREGVNYIGTQETPSMEGRNQHEALNDERNEGEGDERPLDVGIENDESHLGEAWFLGLMEGEYEELSVGERLNALVALVNLVKSGNSVRRAVKDPLDSSSQFFLQVEPQRIGGSKNGRNQTGAPKKSNKRGRSCKLSELSCQKSHSKGLPASGRRGRESFSMQCNCLGSDRRYNTYWHFIRSGSLPDPGSGRVYFESSEDGHWEVIDNEEALETFMALLDSRNIREANLFASLRSHEALLRQEMRKSKACRNQDISGDGSERYEREIMSSDSSSVASIIENNQNSTISEPENDSSGSPGAISLEFGRSEMEKQHEWNRDRAFDKWVWSGFFQILNVLKYNPDLLVSCESCHDLYWPEEGHCKLCHTTFELDFDSEERYAVHIKKCGVNTGNDCIHRHKVLSSRLQSLKAGMQAVEAVLPDEALEISWKRSGQKVWIKRLRRASSPSELAQVLGDLENAIRDDWLHSYSLSLRSKSVCREMIPIFSGTPQTIASMAFWLVRFDAIISANEEKIHTKDTCQKRLRSK